MSKKDSRSVVKDRIHTRIRKKISGTVERPRLAVFKSNQNIYAQIIDDTAGVTLTASSTLDPELKKALEKGGNIEAAQKVGADIAEKAKAKGITKVVYDRGGFIYHGKIKALADAARENGLDF
ncbi:50S ribosomal protein L18 [bacterium]|nr:MAG: 50S ribosomal protein L18 [bacterium]